MAGAVEKGLELGDIEAAVRRVRPDRLLDLDGPFAEQIEQAGPGLPGFA